MRRLLIIISVLVVLLGIGGFVYWKYFSGGPALVVTPPATSATLPAAGQAPAGAGQSSLSITESAAALQVVKVSDRLTKIAVGPIVPGVALVPVVSSVASGSSTLAASSTSVGAGTDTAVEFVERASGNIFSYLLGAGTLTRTSNKTVPGILRADWLPSGRVAFATYLSDDLSTANTYALAADGSRGFFLPQGLSDLAVSSTSVLMLASGATGSVATLAKPDGSGQKAVWSSPLSMLRIAFGGNGSYFAFTKPSQSILGDLFLVSAAGRFTRVAGPLPGLVALPDHKGDRVLISSANAGVMQLSILDVSTRALTALPVATIADKCAWSADDSAIYCGIPVEPSTSYNYPDDWYQGAVHFSDRIWKIDVAGRFAQLAFDPSSVASMGSLDAESLTLDSTGSTLVFINKNGGSLWSYAL
ncbi:MAG: hypothetical protein KGI78_00255 [Patescibacteria group bacterium]|nr:hypothetical protein [Patescibacteria group bacterium]MDE1944065.1 hypothetical protein [Patescibacteria group bacterium]MDE1944726.1 hypothetical protein [Patescibacteria group bacterium]MDE2057270.1 hypothetical protein [Patescibacteria group bacterium]